MRTTQFINVRTRAPMRGQSLTEFALILPLLLLFVLGLFDLGYAVFINNMISNAAREGARAGVILANTDAVITARADAAAPGLNIQVTITPPQGSPSRTFNSPISVTVSYVYVPLTPFIGHIIGQQHLSATSVMTIEGVTQY